MDKGMDIGALRCLLALHGALYLAPKQLEQALEALRERVRNGAAPSALVRATELIARQYQSSAAWAAADAALEWMGPGRSILCKWQPGYPQLLAEINHPPPILFVRGQLDTLGAPHIGIVGSRDGTPGGRDTAYWLANELAARGFSIVSGLARGIDGAAHRGALAVSGMTVAILGCGIDRIYPKSHSELAVAITRQGALVSELPFGTAPLKQHFPLRNRIISGFGTGLIVVEANLSSGSLITAGLALEQGREVFAVPGSIRNPWTKGCHALIRQGAYLVEGPDDVIAALPTYAIPARPIPARSSAHVAAEDPPKLTEEVRRALGFDAVTADMLLERTGLTMHRLSSILLDLELSGSVRSLPGGYYERIDAQGPP